MTMQRFKCVYHLLFIFEVMKISHGEYKTNYNELMGDYFLLCGPDYFCKEASETHQWDITLEYSYKTLQICPDCRCDYECIRRGDCCPDVFFSFPELKCVNRTIIKASDDHDRKQHSSTLMVTSCPPDANQELQHKCEHLNDTKSRLLNFPVSAKTVPLTYFNKYCARCYNVEDYEYWTLDIKCSLFADFNYLSTIDDVIDMAVDRECIFQAFHPNKNSISEDESCFVPLQTTIVFTQCNETGEWVNFSQSVKNACESEYKRGFRMFKNVFCYMCNPSRQGFTSNIISTCNVTGQWRVNDPGLEQACNELPISPTTAPYRNIFCYLCNRRNDSNQQFVDMNGDLSEFTLLDDFFRFEYRLRVDTFNLEYFMHITRNYMKKDQGLKSEIFQPFSESTIKTANNVTVNLTNILTQEASITPFNVRVCQARRSLFPEDYNGICDCSISCILKSGLRCCADLAIELPTSCRDELELSNIKEFRYVKEGYLVIDGCFQEKTYSLFKEGCLRRKFTDLYSILPLSLNNSVSYNNFYCSLCNLDSENYMDILKGSYKSRYNEPSIIKESSDSLFKTIDNFLKEKSFYEVWDLDIICPKYLDFSHLLTTADLISLTWYAECRVRYRTKTKKSSRCGTRRGGKCAQFQNWTYSDADVEWACNNVIPYSSFYAVYFGNAIPSHLDRDRTKTYRRKYYLYSNIFCALCKPSVNFTTNFVDVCSVTNNSYCEIFPRSYYYYPFKNIHCAICNGMSVASVASPSRPTKIPGYGRRSDIGWFPILRNLFSISEDNLEETSTAVECGTNQVFDYKTQSCRNLTCFGGKYLYGISCYPLLQVTKNLRYLVQFDAEILSGNASIWDCFSSVKRELEKSLNASDVIFERIFIRNVGNCKRSRAGSTTTCVYFKLHLFIRSSVPRLDVELALTNFRYKTIRIKDNSLILQLYAESNVQQEDKWDVDLKHYLTQIQPPLAQDNPLNYYMSRVSEALLCRLVILEEEEYNVTENGTLLLSKLGVIVPYNKKDATPSGEVRICYDYLVDIGYIIPSNISWKVPDIRLKYLWIISLICTIISMLCLLFSLAVYCLFPALRTTPGKLLMIMMTSLLFTLLFLNLSAFVVKLYAGCVLVGIVSHFCWLSVFTSMQACNFNIFKTFAISKPSANASRGFIEKTILKNLLYVFGLPLLIVGINMIIAHFTNSSSAIGYGGNKCFIDNKIALIISFIIPVALMCLSNIFFLLFTVRAIHMTPNPESNQRERNELAIFFRLASITGLSWLLQVIDSFLPLTAFTFVATVINCLQGLFIFLAFIMNKRTMGYVRRIYRRDESEVTSSANISKTGVSYATQSSKL